MLEWRQIAQAQDDFFDEACEILREYSKGKLYIAALRGNTKEFDELLHQYLDDRAESILCD